jgi:hypothetical protein
MNGLGITCAGAEHGLAIEKGCAEVMRQASVEENLGDRAVRQQGYVRLDSLFDRKGRRSEKDSRRNAKRDQESEFGRKKSRRCGLLEQGGRAPSQARECLKRCGMGPANSVKNHLTQWLKLNWLIQPELNY